MTGTVVLAQVHLKQLLQSCISGDNAANPRSTGDIRYVIRRCRPNVHRTLGQRHSRRAGTRKVSRSEDRLAALLGRRIRHAEKELQRAVVDGVSTDGGQSAAFLLATCLHAAAEKYRALGATESPSRTARGGCLTTLSCCPVDSTRPAPVRLGTLILLAGAHHQTSLSSVCRLRRRRDSFRSRQLRFRSPSRPPRRGC